MAPRRLLLLACGVLGCSTLPEEQPAGSTSSSGAVTTDIAPTSADATTDTPDPTPPDGVDGSSSTTGASPNDIVPGVGIGPVLIGTRWSDLEPLLGKPDTTLRFGNLLFTTFDTPGIEVLFASPAETTIDANSLVLSVAALGGSAFGGSVTPGDMRPDVELALGDPSEEIDDVAFYVDGISVRYAEGAAEIVTVYAPYTLRPLPPPMTAFEVPR